MRHSVIFHSDNGLGEIGIKLLDGLPLLKASSQRSMPNSGGMVCIGLSLLVTNMVHGVGSLAPLWGGTSA